jgi:hypothetical protein
LFKDFISAVNLAKKGLGEEIRDRSGDEKFECHWSPGNPGNPEKCV